MADLHTRLAVYHDMLDARLRKVLDGTVECSHHYEMMGYHFGILDEQLQPSSTSGGKHLRPDLCFLACESVGAAAEDALPGAVALELLHNFSLVHDDIEDNSELRRHRRTVWTLWGVPHGINVGDGIFALAHLTLTDDVPDAETAIHAARVFDRTSVELCDGQFLDLQYQDATKVTFTAYLTMIRKKTAAMFGCAMELGALLGAAPPDVRSRLRHAGQALGMAFQMQDDLLGTWGDERQTGKSVTDVRDRKRALPAVLAWDNADGEDLAALSLLFTRPDPLDDADVAWVHDLYDRLGVRQQAESITTERFALADHLLIEALPTEQTVTPIRQFIELLRDRHIGRISTDGGPERSRSAVPS